VSASIFVDTYLILIAASVGGHDATLTIIEVLAGHGECLRDRH
jgi:hypothetical protein